MLSVKMYCLVAYNDIKDDLLKYLRSKVNTYHWIVGTMMPDQNCWFIWHNETDDHFSRTKIGQFLYQNKGKFITQYCFNKGKLPPNTLYVYTKDLNEADMVKCITETNVTIYENECCFPSHFNKEVLQPCFVHYSETLVEHAVTKEYDAANVHSNDLDMEIEKAEKHVEQLKQTRRERDKLILKPIDVNEMNHLLDL